MHTDQPGGGGWCCAVCAAGTQPPTLEQLQALCDEIGYKLVATPGEDEFFIMADDDSVSYSNNPAGIHAAYQDVSHDAQIIRAQKEQA
jgi:hypothetical protein